MGLLGDWMKSKNMKDPVRGTLQVTASTYPPSDATSANYSINGVVSADGVPPTAIEHAGIAKIKKWPRSGQSLPVTVDRADPTRVRIEWDEIQDSWEAARHSAEAMAQAMRGAAATPAAPVSAMPGVTTVDATGVPGLREEIMKLATSGGSPQQIMDALRARGIQVPDASALHMFSAGMPGAFAAGAAHQEEDPAERLRKLQDLRAQGLITEEEYEAQRKRVLGDI